MSAEGKHPLYVFVEELDGQLDQYPFDPYHPTFVLKLTSGSRFSPDDFWGDLLEAFRIAARVNDTQAKRQGYLKALEDVENLLADPAMKIYAAGNLHWALERLKSRAGKEEPK